VTRDRCAARLVQRRRYLPLSRAGLSTIAALVLLALLVGLVRAGWFYCTGR